MTASIGDSISQARDIFRLAVGTDLSSVVSTTPPQAPRGLLEAFVAPKRAGAHSEDFVVITGRHVAVVDGMSSPLRRSSERASGRIFASGAAQVIAAMPEGISARDAVDQITAKLRLGASPLHDGPSGAVAAIYSLARQEVWRIGDVHLRIGSRDMPGRKAVDLAMAGYRAATNAVNLASGMALDVVINTDPGLASVSKLLEMQPVLANRDVAFGYGVLNGTRVPDRFLEVEPVPFGAQVVLASDGYLNAAPTLAAGERALRAAIAQDPACIGVLWEMGKSVASGADAPDDRCYVRVDTANHER
jgi:hypothetical protein